MKKFIIGICLFFLLLIGAGGLKYFLGYSVFRDVSYGEAEACVMDVYIPKRAIRRENNGCVLLIHGGSWSGGDKREEELKCRLLASHGYIAASVNYTLWSEQTAAEYTVFGVLDELDTALGELKSFLSDKGISTDKAAIGGYSAGAHLAMLYSYSRADTAPMEIAFTLNMAGPSDVCSAVWGNEMTVRIAQRLTGKEISEDMLLSGEADQLLASISPVSYVNENTPPTLIAHGGRDDVVPLGNAEALIERLREYSVEHEYIYMKTSNHMLIQNPFKRMEYLKAMLEYCKAYF